MSLSLRKSRVESSRQALGGGVSPGDKKRAGSWSVPLLELNRGHGDRPRLGDPPCLDAGHHGHSVLHRHFVQDRAARMVVQPPLQLKMGRGWCDVGVVVVVVRASRTRKTSTGMRTRGEETHGNSHKKREDVVA